ncbi:MAG TPA: heme exporter protein CcmB, partial [Acidimicrobiia bacterium]|nr:heme exporter protein CcmB [Acidimicrobiia bacterium]
MTRFWSQAGAIARHEMLVERRAGETFGLVLPFALAALITIPLAVGIDQPTISRLGLPAFWVVTLLFGMQIAWRQTTGLDQSVRDQIRLSGIDPAAAFVGRAIANLALLFGFMVVSLLLSILLYSPPGIRRWPAFAVALVLFAIGLSVISTLVADLTLGLAARAGLAPLLVAPLSLPLLFAGAQTGELASAGAANSRPGGILAWLLVLALVDLIGVIAGVVSARPLEEIL